MSWRLVLLLVAVCLFVLCAFGVVMFQGLSLLPLGLAALAASRIGGGG